MNGGTVGQTVPVAWRVKFRATHSVVGATGKTMRITSLYEPITLLRRNTAQLIEDLLKHY